MWHLCKVDLALTLNLFVRFALEQEPTVGPGTRGFRLETRIVGAQAP